MLADPREQDEQIGRQVSLEYVFAQPHVSDGSGFVATVSNANFAPCRGTLCQVIARLNLTLPML